MHKRFQFGDFVGELEPAESVDFVPVADAVVGEDFQRDAVLLRTSSSA